MIVQDKLDAVFSLNDKESFKKVIERTLESVLSSTNDESAFSGIDPYTLRKEVTNLGLIDKEGLGFDKVLTDTKKVILPNLLRPWSTSYMPHLHSPVLPESLAAEIIISFFNNSMDSWDQAPAATELEVYVIDELLKMVGFNSGDGTFTSGGSQSNFSAITAIRDAWINKNLNHDVKKLGLPKEYNRLRLYTSSISHFSMDKSAHVLGLGYNAVRHIPVDEYCRIDTIEFEKMLKEDTESGLLPFCAVATIGTTDFGSIDDVKKMRELCDKYGLFLHADAAYGSGLLLSDKYSFKVKDLSLADSITIDFHKMFLLNISCSCVLFKDKELLSCFELHADYLNREEDEADGYINLVGKGMQTTRRFDALKVYMAFRSRGFKGYSEIINRAVENANYFYNKIKSDKRFITGPKPEISSVVFALDRDDEVNKKLRRELLSEGTVIGQTVFKGKVMLKFTLLNPALTEEKINSLINRILKAY